MKMKAIYQFRQFFRRPEKSWGVILFLLLIFLVVVPAVYILLNSFVFDAAGIRLVRGAQLGQATIFYWTRVLHSRISKAILYEPALHSVSIAVGMTAISLSLGAFLAWLVVRTNLPWKRFFSMTLIIPYIVPSWTVALAWIMVFKSKRFGGTPGLLNALFGVDVPEWISFGYVPIIIALGVHYIPYTFILMRGALANIDSRLEESAELLGANRFEILRKITFPITLPALGSAFILTFSKGLGEFATQAFLGLPIRYYTLSTRVYSTLSNRLYGEGYVLALILILTTAVMVWANQALLGTRKAFVTISGKGTRKKAVDLGVWRRPAAFGLLLFVIVFVLGPLLLLGWQTLMRYEGQYGFDNVTLHYWFGKADPELAEGQPGIFRNPFILGAIKNSVLLAGATAIISGIIGILLGYTVVRNRGHILSRAIENLSFVPYMVPGIAFGGIFLTMFARSWGPVPALYGTFTLLVLTCVVKYLPYSSSSGIAAMHQIDPSLEEVGVIHGISWRTRFTRIVMPLSKAGILSAMLLTLVTTMRVLDVVVLLVTPKTTLMTSIIFRYQTQDFTQHAYAIMLVIVFIILAAHFYLHRLGGKIEL
ncbi:ABC transporter permease [candidate division KSB3 bacterium]|uniref:ABC transporter permease n=1 Tax=candidate division KSB3 bacterium TaxID=2044937 RepID=A0A2G6KF72_9BACT|nr:MAG: ABC transporter permease [candidate division KSB3 bacterium]